MIDTELGDFFQMFPGLVDIIGTRTYPGGHLPQRKGTITTTLPALTFHDVSDVSHYSQPQQVEHYRVVRYQVDAWAVSLEDARRLAELVKEVLDGYNGPMGPRTIGFVERQGRPSMYEPTIALWHVPADYIIHIMS